MISPQFVSYFLFPFPFPFPFSLSLLIYLMKTAVCDDFWSNYGCIPFCPLSFPFLSLSLCHSLSLSLSLSFFPFLSLSPFPFPVPLCYSFSFPLFLSLSFSFFFSYSLSLLGSFLVRNPCSGSVVHNKTKLSMMKHLFAPNIQLVYFTLFSSLPLLPIQTHCKFTVCSLGSFIALFFTV